MWKDGESEMERNARFRSKLRKWAIQHQTTHLAFKDLIHIINNTFGQILPEDPRTLLRTPQSVLISKIGQSGQFWHHGFVKCLKTLFKNTYESKTISVNINMDGLPIYNSSKVEFRPILFNITEMPEFAAMVIGIYCGTSKCRDVHQFLTPFVDELKESLTNGIHIGSHTITVHLRCIVCDSPARAYVKGM